MKYFFLNEHICGSSITSSLNMYILKLKKDDFARLIFYFKRWGQNLYIRVFKIGFQLVIFKYLKNHLIKIVNWPNYGIIIESSKFSDNKNGENYRNHETGWEVTFRNYCNASKTLKQL